MEHEDPERANLRRALARGDRLYTAHVVLLGIAVVWRGVLATPGLGVDDGATWTSSAFGRGCALVSVLFGVAALGVVIATTLQLARDRAAWALLAALVLALAWRERVDVFDVVYALAVLAFATYWFRERRTALAERVLARAPIAPRG